MTALFFCSSGALDTTLAIGKGATASLLYSLLTGLIKFFADRSHPILR